MLEKLRLRLASANAVVLLTLLGILSGALVGGVMILFRQVIERTQTLLLNSPEELYENLTWQEQVILPIAGALIIAAIFALFPHAARRVGVVHVIERLNYHQGYLPFKNALLQFVGGAISIISGHSVGREGPSIHLGAASSSLLGQWMELPNNSLRTLVACGVAASIAASFNTPLAGVIFAMEVIMMEYTIVSFTPVIASAVMATVVTRLVYGPDPAFIVPSLEMASVAQMPYIALAGFVLGSLSALFIVILKRTNQHSSERPMWLRFLLAGLLTALVAPFVPQIMGIGYDTVALALNGEMLLKVLLLVTIAKIVVTAITLGLGIPGGLIGPTLVMGAAAGGSMGVILGLIFGSEIADVGFYAMLGMAAMMGAILQAPLAALTALLELTYNPNIILPGMLIVIIANLTSRHLFKQESAFYTLFKQLGLDYRNSPIHQSLRREGVANVMERNFSQQPAIVSREEAEQALEQKPAWIVVTDQEKPDYLLPAVDLVNYLNDNPDLSEVDLIRLPAKRLQLSEVFLRDSLLEADEVLTKTQAEALYVVRPNAPFINRIYGVLTKEDVERAYRK